MGPNFTPFRHCYQWLVRSGIAGRLCPTDQAGVRPKGKTGKVGVNVQSYALLGASRFTCTSSSARFGASTMKSGQRPVSAQ